jgi:hypothetical protein
MTDDDLLLRDWRNLFHPDRAFMLRWLTPAQRAALEARMLADTNEAIRRLIGNR